MTNLLSVTLFSVVMETQGPFDRCVAFIRRLPWNARGGRELRGERAGVLYRKELCGTMKRWRFGSLSICVPEGYYSSKQGCRFAFHGISDKALSKLLRAYRDSRDPHTLADKRQSCPCEDGDSMIRPRLGPEVSQQHGQGTN